MTNASILNGSLLCYWYQPFTLTNSLIGVTILNTIGNLIATNNVFTQPNTIKIRSFEPSYSGGNTFEKTTYISNYGEGELFFGYDLPDMFEDSVFISTFDLTTSSTGDIHMAYNSDSNTFNGIFQLDLYSASSIYFCDGSDSASVSFYSPVKIGGVLFANAIEFSRNAHFHTGAPLGLSDLGWITGELRLIGVTMDDSLSIVMDNDEYENSIIIDKGSLFSSKVNCTAQSIYLGEVTFNDSTTFVKTGEGTDQLKSGHIKANAPFTFNNLGYGSFLSSYVDSCTFNSDITLINANEGTIQLASFGLLNIGGNLNISTTAGLISLGESSTDTIIVQGNIDLNCSGGLVVLGMIKQGNTGTINTITFENSELDLLGYRSTNTDSLIITGTDNSRLVLNKCQIEGPFQVELPSIVINEGIYNGNTLFHKTGNDCDQGGGSMVFHGKAHFKTSSEGDLLLNYGESNNQFLDDLIIECTGDGKVLTATEGSSDLYKNFEFKGSTAPDLNQGSVMNFVGSYNQHILSIGSINDFSLATLLVEKPLGELIIDIPLHIQNEIKLNKGIIQLSDSNSLFLDSTAVVLGGNDSSYVEGPITKEGTTAFTFPLGRNGHFKPLTISAPATSTTFKAEYANKNPSEVHSFSSKDTTLNRISTNEYWMLERTSGTANVTATFSIDNMGCQFDSLSHLKVAAWNGSQWKDKGNGGTTGTNNEGTISTSGTSSTYGMFTLGTSDTLRCVPCRADAGADKIIDGIPAVIIGLEITSADSFAWSPSQGIHVNGFASAYANPGVTSSYTLLVVNSQDCAATDDVVVVVVPRPFPVFNHRCVSPASN